mmetsp:Transcript_11652/g.33564  ORF Transcript_11652/g.33564 Transcript_11652/m.33564 type:complete len:240 (+) Transcript_11652:129-848(+)
MMVATETAFVLACPMQVYRDGIPGGCFDRRHCYLFGNIAICFLIFFACLFFLLSLLLSLRDVVVAAFGSVSLGDVGLGFLSDDLGHFTCGSGSDLLHLLELLGELEVSDLLRGGALERLFGLGAWWKVVALLHVSILGGVVGRDGKHSLVLVADGRQFGECSGSRSAVGLRSDGVVVLLLVGIVSDGILLLLEGDGQSVVAVFLRQVRVVKSSRHLDGGSRCLSGTHHDVVALWRLAFF